MTPDIFFVSEVNLFSSTPEWNRNIEGYRMFLPKSWLMAGYAWMVLLAKEGVDVHLLPEHMEDDLAAVWVRVGRKTRKPMQIGGLYREHKLPAQGELDREELLSRQRQIGQTGGELGQCCSWGKVHLYWRPESGSQ